ncbi:MAG: SWIM zinc finger family protein [Myxococcota bacterium]|jgi:hypothetical protein|nr:SWIM zinc finger family protein [Myxococcota bacterium]
MTRPRVAPDLLAAFVAAAPSRVTRRLDADPRVAESWTWSASESDVVIDAGEVRVSLKGAVLIEESDVACSCLLAPRCLHVLAVLSVLPIAEGVASEAKSPHAAEARASGASSASESSARSSESSESATSASSVRSSESTESVDDHAELVDDDQRAVATRVWGVVNEVLHGGLAQTGTVRLGELLRVAHACRLAGAVRLESALLGVFEAARDLRERRASFRASEACARMAEALELAHRLGRGDAAALGSARRVHAPVSGLRVAGLATAPIARRGYAGVVTYFTDGVRIYSAQELVPGETSRARDAFDAPLRFGEISLTHREASKVGLLFARAEVSRDGRLGAGKNVVCVAVARDEALVDRLFAIPLDAQLAAADRGGVLVCLEGVIARANGAFALTREGGGAIPMRPTIDEPIFAGRDNLSKLAEAGVRARFVTRLADDGAALEPIAVRFEGESTWRSLDDERLGQASVPRGEPRSWSPPEVSDALGPLRLRAVRFALAGARSLPSAAHGELAREAARARDRLLPTAADALLALARHRDTPAAAWLALQVYLEAAERSLRRETW